MCDGLRGYRRGVTMLLATAALAGVMVLTACGPLPRPFQPQEKSPSGAALTAPPSPETLAIAPVAGLLPEDADAGAALLAEELRRYNIAAAAGPGNASSLYLEGRVTSQGLLWLVSEADGTIRATARQSLGRSAGALTWGDPAVLRGVMVEAAQTLVPKLSAAEAGGLPGHPGARLAIAPVGPAPEEAARLLGSSIRVSLSQAALPLIELQDASGEDLLLQGSVRIGPEQGGVVRVDVIWELLDAAGNSLGSVSQGDLVPVLYLNQFWPDTAPVIADAAVEGIVDLLYRTGQPGGGQPGGGGQ